MKFARADVFVTAKKHGRVEADYIKVGVFADSASESEIFDHFEKKALKKFRKLGAVPVILDSNPEVTHAVPLSRVRLFEILVTDITEYQFDEVLDS